FNDIAFTPPVTTPPSRHNPENTGISPGTGGVSGSLVGGVGGGVAGEVPAVSEQATDLPDVLKAAHALTDEQAISNCTIAYQQHSMAVSKRVSFRKRFKTFRNSKMLLSSGTFRNI
ncbi:MAG TPA: hypothetical protein VJZ75_01690, partial [Candidatus Bathyarchaeia archaeon]|nr:hypothetical protein [Candidatus Bathyarchaeia archaeon]